MRLNLMKTKPQRQSGSSLIEVLVAILIISFGLLSMAGMLSFGIQLPKLAGYRATATYLASSHIESIRANPEGFAAGSYTASLNDSSAWSTTAIAISGSNCSFTGTQCTQTTLASADTNVFRNAVRRELPSGDIVVTRSCLVTSPCNAAAPDAYGEVWVVWKEPDSFAALAGSNDNCHSSTSSLASPRCLHVRFQIQ